MTTVRCPQCGTEFDKDANEFCPNPGCGYPSAFILASDAEASESDDMLRRPGEQATAPQPVVAPAPVPAPRPVRPAAPPPPTPSASSVQVATPDCTAGPFQGSLGDRVLGPCPTAMRGSDVQQLQL